MNKKFFQKLRKEKIALFSFIILSFYILIALFANYITPYNPYEINLSQRLKGPSLSHPFGFDELGRDELSRIIMGTRISISIGLLVVVITFIMGITVGGICAYLGGIFDEILMRATDVLLAMPGILLAIAIVSFLGTGIFNLIFALTVMGWISYARLIRGEVLKIKNQDYVLAAKISGSKTFKIFFRHILRNSIDPAIVQGILNLGGVIISEASLSFLGLGISPPTPSWGNMLSMARVHLFDAPHLIIFPSIILASLIFSVHFLGEFLEEMFIHR